MRDVLLPDSQNVRPYGQSNTVHHIAGYETPYTECGQKQLCFRWSACLSSIEANIKHWDWLKNNLPNMGLIMLNTRNETCGSGSQLGDSGFIKPEQSQVVSRGTSTTSSWWSREAADSQWAGECLCGDADADDDDDDDADDNNLHNEQCT